MQPTELTEKTIFIHTICLILDRKEGGGSFEIVNSISKKIQRFSLATGLARDLALKRYNEFFGTLPPWVDMLHPAKQISLCELAMELKLALPAEHPTAD